MLSANPSAEQKQVESGGRRFGIYIAFIPWVLFTLITQHATLEAAAVVALLGAVAIALPAQLTPSRDIAVIPEDSACRALAAHRHSDARESSDRSVETR